MKLRITIGVVAIIGVLALAWVFGVSPQLQQAAQDAQSRASVVQLTSVYRARLHALTADKQNLSSLETKLAAARAYIPDDPALGAFLAELNQLESTFHVQVTAYQAADPVPAGSSATTASAAASTTGSSTGGSGVSGAAGNLYQIPVQVQVQGDYDKIVDFTGALEKGPRLLIADKVSIGAAQTGAGFAGTVSGELYVVSAKG